MANFSWGKTLLAIFLAGISLVTLIMGLFGWVSEVYGRQQDTGLSKVAVVVFILSEVALFGGLFGGYLYNMFPAEIWPPANTPDGIPPVGFAVLLSLFLFSSSLTIHRAESLLRVGNTGGFISWLVFTLLLGGLFILGQAKEWSNLIGEGFTVSTNAYGTFFYSITGFHGSHVLVGLVLQLFVLIMALRGRLSGQKHTIMKATGYYWHFVDGVWLLVFLLIYVLPYKG
jgi:cytochrome c oxidase subunit 3